MESASNHGKECSNETIADIDNRAEDNSVGKISFACHTLNTFGSKKAKKVLAADFEPNEYTVILGRGSSTDSTGHRHLRLVVQSYLQQYLDAPDKLGKSLIVSRVYDTVKKVSPAAAFVKFNNGTWVDVGERTSREKIGKCSFYSAIEEAGKCLMGSPNAYELIIISSSQVPCLGIV